MKKTVYESDLTGEELGEECGMLKVFTPESFPYSTEKLDVHPRYDGLGLLIGMELTSVDEHHSNNVVAIVRIGPGVEKTVIPLDEANPIEREVIGIYE